MPTFLSAWHGCLAHNANHCHDCRTCDCHTTTTTEEN